METYWFFCRRWLATDEDDRQIVRELLPSTEEGRPLGELAGTALYTVLCHKLHFCT